MTQKEPHMLLELALSGVSVGSATCLTNPIDVIKTRLQLQHLQGHEAMRRMGMVETAQALVRQEGVTALWKGLTPALARGFVYGGGCVLHTLPHVVTVVAITAIRSVMAGMLSGGLAAALTSPTELVKTRLQSRTNTLCSPWQVVRQVLAEQGVHGLWKGALPGMVRASLLTASQCATYDEVKRRVMHNTGWADGTATQLACSLVTGLVTTTITNPVDVVKTTLYVSGDRYSGALRAAADILRREGPRGLLSGWVANYTRLGPQTMVTFLVAERLRVLAGLDSL
ncbi:mitochondrial carrier domain-containing protein [Haematococcus lacustris]